jgi:hypothetical protein
MDTNLQNIEFIIFKNLSKIHIGFLIAVLVIYSSNSSTIKLHYTEAINELKIKNISIQGKYEKERRITELLTKGIDVIGKRYDILTNLIKDNKGINVIAVSDKNESEVARKVMYSILNSLEVKTYCIINYTINDRVSYNRNVKLVHTDNMEIFKFVSAFPVILIISSDSVVLSMFPINSGISFDEINLIIKILKLFD